MRTSPQTRERLHEIQDHKRHLRDSLRDARNTTKAALERLAQTATRQDAAAVARATNAEEDLRAAMDEVVEEERLRLRARE